MVNEGNVGFIGGTKYNTSFGSVVRMYEFFGDAVRITLSTGGSFTCGTEQLIHTDIGWVKAEELKGCMIKGVEFVDISPCGKQQLFDLSLNTPDHCYEINVDGIILLAHNIPSIGGYIAGGETKSVPAGDMYKYIPYKAIKNVFRSTTIRAKIKTPNIDASRLVILGGPFEKIGDEDEAIGGGNQKMGTTNQ